MDKDFDIMNTILATYVLMVYPNHYISFHIHTDASNYQVGNIIIKQKSHFVLIL